MQAETWELVVFRVLIAEAPGAARRVERWNWQDGISGLERCDLLCQPVGTFVTDVELFN